MEPVDLQKRYSLFLRYGYELAQCQKTLAQLDAILDREKVVGDRVDDHRLIGLLKEHISSIIPVNSRDRIIVPLSGGLDSRLLLSVLAEDFDKQRILCVTYGGASSYDRLIAGKVTRALGVEAIQLSVGDVDWGGMVTHAAKWQSPKWFVDSFLNSFEYVRRPKDYLLIGYMGDPVSGSHYSTSMEGQSPLASVRSFLASNQVCEELSPPCEVESYLQKLKFIDERKLPFSEQLDLTVRQAGLVRGVFPMDQRTITPFASPRWMQAMLNLDAESRVGQHRYKRLCASRFERNLSFAIKADLNMPERLNRLKWIKKSALKVFRVPGRPSLYETRMSNYVPLGSKEFTSLIFHVAETTSLDITEYISRGLGNYATSLLLSASIYEESKRCAS